jgi:uncharacterized coiled-coil DUF342 family protein
MVIDWSVVSAVIISIGSLITALATRYQSKDHKNLTAVEMAERVMGIANTKLTEMIETVDKMKTDTEDCRNELKELRDKVDKLCRDNRDFTAGIKLLCHQLKSMGQNPVWCLPEWEEK